MNFQQTINQKAPYLSQLWDWKTRSYKPSAVEQYMSTASTGEIIMAKFFLGVWRGDNHFNFDFNEAAASLDENNMKTITDWMLNPIWP